MKKGVGIIGYGALGKILAGAILNNLKDVYILTGIYTRTPEKSRKELESQKIHLYENLEKMLSDPRADFVVEMAGVQAVVEYSKRILQSGKHLILTSVGALADRKLREELEITARNYDRKIYIPSGAIGGFDVYRAISMMGEAEGIIESVKAPESLNGAPFLQGRILSEIKQETVFEGTAEEAIDGFPKNVNVAVSSALSSVGVENMRTRIISCPGMKENMHRVTVKNNMVRAVLEVSSKPDPTNPKSSILTAWSIASLLENLAAAIEFY